MERRTILKAVGASTVVGMTVLAGCSGGGNGDGGGGGNGTEASGGGAQTTGGEQDTTQSAGSTATAGGAGSTPTTGTGGGTSTAGTGTSAPTTGAGGTSPAGTGATTTSSGGNLSTAETGTNATTSGAGTGGTTTIGMYTEGSNYYFDPIGLFVESGTTVTFEIESGNHSSVAYQEGNGPAQVTRIPQGAEAWESDILTGSKSFEHTFDTEGTYDYFCTPHKSLGMVGRIVVGSPGGPAEGSMPPDGDVPESQAIVEQGSISYSDFS